MMIWETLTEDLIIGGPLLVDDKQFRKNDGCHQRPFSMALLQAY
jgi:hypothetical protein